MTDLVLVRHGETVWHHDNRYTGRTDVALTERGRRQAEQLARWAGTAELTAVWTSPLSRAFDTATAVATATTLRPQVDKRLTELDFGDGEGLTSREMGERFPEARRAFEADPVAAFLPGGEDPVHAAERAETCLTEIARAFPDGHVLVVGHSTLHRLVLCRLLGLPLSSYRTVFPIVGNCAITTVRWHGEGTAALLEYNRPVEGSVAA